MLSDIYYRKKLGIPYLSLIFLVSCLLVSIPSYFFPDLAKVLGGIRPMNYPWQYITMVFEHGFGSVPLFLHLLVNGVVIVFFGIISERLLGTKKFFIFTIVSAIIYYLKAHFILNDWSAASGISGIIWGYSVIVFYLMCYLYKYDRNKLLKDPIFYFGSFMLLMIWVVITIADILVNGYISYGIVSHFISVIVGIIFIFIWKKNIKSRINEILESDKPKQIFNSSLDKKIVKCSLIVPIFIIVILLLSFTGILSKHVISLEVGSIVPEGNTIKDINKSDRQIRINFSSPLKKEIEKSSLYSMSEKRGSQKLSMEITWLNNKTLIIKFNRKINKNEKIKVVLAGFSNLKGISSSKEIVLKYGYNE